ncbi:hypothetical protein PA01_12750 [Azoarcus sp. PA01]|nr:hypothetical protein PA01_12750 [Azoarcus sp. PA01]
MDANKGKAVKSMLQQICEVIGFEATCEMSGWLGGRSLYVPDIAHPNHVIAQLLGRDAFAELVAVFGGQTIDLPAGDIYMRARRNREVTTLLSDGYSERYVANRFRMTTSNVRSIRRRAERMGVLPMILRRKGWPQVPEVEQRRADQFELPIDDRDGRPGAPVTTAPRGDVEPRNLASF